MDLALLQPSVQQLELVPGSCLLGCVSGRLQTAMPCKYVYIYVMYACYFLLGASNAGRVPAL